MKERKVMNKICSSILKTSKHIKFVSVVDGNCKLLVGRSRRSGNRRAHAYYYRLHGYIFYLEYLIFAIDNLKMRLRPHSMTEVVFTILIPDYILILQDQKVMLW